MKFSVLVIKLLLMILSFQTQPVTETERINKLNELKKEAEKYLKE